MTDAEIRRPEALRWLVMIAMAGIGALLFMAAIGAYGRAPMTTFIMLPFAAALGWVALELWRAPASAIRFDGERLVDNSGEVICTVDEIVEVNRGFALFKPTKGFVLTLKAPKRRGWSPGLWWRVGRQVGVGGATPGRGARDLADALTATMAMRAMEAAAKPATDPEA